MKRLVLHATDTAQWQALVHEAEAAAECSLSVETESYLVFTLMRFVGRARLAKTCLALGYLAGLLQRGPLRRQGLRDVGDQCLLYTGLFPDHALRGAVPLGYYVGLGKSAYLHLSGEPSGELFPAAQSGLRRDDGCLAVHAGAGRDPPPRALGGTRAVAGDGEPTRLAHPARDHAP